MIFVQLLLVALFLVLFVQPIAVYLLDRKHLRRFPSPTGTYAAISNIWRMIRSRRQDLFLALNDAHEKHGTHVRVGPNHISISDPAAIYEIYGHGAGFLKEGFYDSGTDAVGHSVFSARSREQHRAKRRLLAHAFAPKTLTDLDGTIVSVVESLITRMDKLAEGGKPFDLSRYLNFFAVDFLTGIMYGEPLHLLDNGHDMVPAETPSGEVYKAPYIKSAYTTVWQVGTLGLEPAWFWLTERLATWLPSKKILDDWQGVVRHAVNKRLRLPESECKPDIFSRFLRNSLGKTVTVPRDEIQVECSLMMTAGTETTAAALAYAMFHLSRHPDVLAKLRAELDAALPGKETGEIPTYNEVVGLPYLRACIEESLRVRPSNTLGLARVVPSGGRTIAGEFIEEGVTVSVPTYTVLKNEEVFPDPYRFNPDRWITGDKEKMLRHHVPFSTGPRACIGRNIAYVEQFLVIATLVRLYDWELQYPERDLAMYERFNCCAGELWMYVRRRSDGKT